jgi:hypothetical protein
VDNFPAQKIYDNLPDSGDSYTREVEPALSIADQSESFLQPEVKPAPNKK